MSTDKYEIKQIDSARGQIIDQETGEAVLEVASTDLSEEEILDLMEPLMEALNNYQEGEDDG